MLLWEVTSFIGRNWISLSIIISFTYVFLFVIRWYGGLKFRECFVLFMQWILVIILMYFLQWSIQASHTGASENLNLYLFQVDVSGKNFLNTFQQAWDAQARWATWSAFWSKILPAFLEELFKFVMLYLFLKNITRNILLIITGLLIGNMIISGNSEMHILLQYAWLVISFWAIWLIFTYKQAKLRSINHGIYALGIIAAGFAFWENIKYLIDHEQLLQANRHLAGDAKKLEYLTQLSFLRSIFWNISHILFSGIIGYFFARGYFWVFDLVDTHHEKKATTWLHFLGTNRFKKIYTIKLTLIGLLFATWIHTVYNFFMSWEQLYGLGGMGGVILTLIAGVGFFEIYVLRESRYITDYNKILDEMKRGQRLKEIRRH